MKFKTVQEAFNHYRTSSAVDIETRAAAIKTEIAVDPSADIDALNIELDGLKQAKENIEERSRQQQQPQQIQPGINPITGMNFSGTVTQNGEDIFSSREYRSAFHKRMLDQALSSEEAAVFNRANTSLAVEKRAAFINTSEAAAVIPSPLVNEIFKPATDEGSLLSIVRRFDLPANITIPIATPEDDAQWHIEGEEVTPDNKKPVNLIFNSYELMKIFSMSANAKTMSMSAYESYLQQELRRVMITALQKSVLFGTGVNQPLGLLTDGVITWDNKNSISGAASYGLFATATGLLKRGYNAGAVWAMNPVTYYNRLLCTTDSTGMPMFNTPRDGNADRILGRPVVIDDFIPDNIILYGNFKYYGMNFPQNIMLEVSRDSSFRRGLIDYRAMAIADGKPIISEAFVKLVIK